MGPLPLLLLISTALSATNGDVAADDVLHVDFSRSYFQLAGRSVLERVNAAKTSSLQRHDRHYHHRMEKQDGSLALGVPEDDSADERARDAQAKFDDSLDSLMQSSKRLNSPNVASGRQQEVDEEARSVALREISSGYNFALGRITDVSVLSLDAEKADEAITLQPRSKEEFTQSDNVSGDLSRNESKQSAGASVDLGEAAKSFGGDRVKAAAEKVGLEGGAGGGFKKSESTQSQRSSVSVSVALKVQRLSATLNPEVVKGMIAQPLKTKWESLEGGKSTDNGDDCSRAFEYFQLYNEFGTHWIHRATLGGVVKLSATVSAEKASSSQLRKVKTAMEAALKGGAKVQGSRQSDSLGAKQSLDSGVTYSLTVTGGDEGLDLLTVDTALNIPVVDGEKLQQWRQSLSSKVAVIDLEGMPIDLLFSGQHDYAKRMREAYVKEAVHVDKMDAQSDTLEAIISTLSNEFETGRDKIQSSGWSFDGVGVKRQGVRGFFHSLRGWATSNDTPQEMTNLGARVVWLKSRSQRICKVICGLRRDVNARKRAIFSVANEKPNPSCESECQKPFDGEPEGDFTDSFVKTVSEAHEEVEGFLTTVGDGMWRQKKENMYMVLDPDDPDEIAYWKDKDQVETAQPAGSVPLSGVLAIATSTRHCSAFGLQLIHDNKIDFLCANNAAVHRKWIAALATYRDKVKIQPEDSISYQKYDQSEFCKKVLGNGQQLIRKQALTARQSSRE